MDDDENIYHPKDILENKCNPRVIKKFHKNEDGTYIIQG